MKKLETVVSSPWELKQEKTSPAPSQDWTELKEKPQYKTEPSRPYPEPPKREPVKQTHIDFVLELYPFGRYIMRNGCPIDRRPPPEVYHAIATPMEARAYRRGMDAPDYIRETRFIFTFEGMTRAPISDHYMAIYRFSGVR